MNDSSGITSEFAGLLGLTLFSRDGCPFCVSAKGLLSSMGVPYAVVDIQAEPTRRKEAIERSAGSTTVPQVFLGTARHLGGYDDLVRLRDSGELHILFRERLKSGDTDSIPGTTEDILAAFRLADCLPPEVMAELRGVGHQIRASRDDGTFRPGRRASVMQFIQYAVNRKPLPYDDQITCLNEPPVSSQRTALASLPADKLLRNLRTMMLQLCEKFGSHAGEVMDYAGLRESDDWFTFLALAAELGTESRRREIQDALEAMGENHRKAFFINLYNIMTFHGVVQYGKKSSTWYMYVFYITPIVSYRIGQSKLSLDQVENGILRAQPGYFIAPAQAECLSLRMPKLDPRIHMALNCGSKSCPAVAVYSGDNLDAELQEAVEGFLASDANVLIELSGKDAITPVLHCSEIFKMYLSDFLGDPAPRLTESQKIAVGLLQWMLPFLSGRKREVAQQAIEMWEKESSRAVFKWFPYNWDVNGEMPFVDKQVYTPRL